MPVYCESGRRPATKEAGNKSPEAVPNLLINLGFAIWVSVCAAAPEFIWQGLLELLHHFSRQTAYSIVLIGLILTVFVEPLLERARDGRWRPEHRSKRSLLFTAPIAFIFGVAAVGLHECMTAYLGTADPTLHGQQDGTDKAAGLIMEWACIPLAVTMAWFSARLHGWVPYVAGVCAAIWVVAAGLYFDWPMPGIVITSIPCILLIPLGQVYVALNWNEVTFRNLALGLAGVSAAWLGLTLVVQAALPFAGFAENYLYGPGEVAENIRFYLGWALGLTLAPNPVPARRSELPIFRR
jgi:hypothetical protein